MQPGDRSRRFIGRAGDGTATNTEYKMQQAPLMADFSLVCFAQEIDAAIGDDSCTVEKIVSKIENAGDDVDIIVGKWFNRNDHTSNVHSATRIVKITAFTADGDTVCRVRQTKRRAHFAHKIETLKGFAAMLP